MIIVKLKGGLGNQMFQYTVGIYLQERYATKVYFDVDFFKKTAESEGATLRKLELDVFSIELANSPLNSNEFKILSKWKKRLKSWKLIPFKERIKEDVGIKVEWSEYHPPLLADGYWQTSYYACANENIVKDKFTFSAPVNPVFNQVKEQIEKETSIAVHVRRGDYVKFKTTNEYHGVCDLNYYTEAISLMYNKWPGLRLFFFTDDPEWVSANLICKYPSSVLVKNENAETAWVDMYLMSLCKGNIIANSTFSWWGAWLNRNVDKQVIAPKQWFADKKANDATKDLIPVEWIRI